MTSLCSELWNERCQLMGNHVRLGLGIRHTADMVVLRLAAAKGLARTLATGLAPARGLSRGLSLALTLTLCLGSLCEFKFKSCAVAGVAFN